MLVCRDTYALLVKQSVLVLRTALFWVAVRTNTLYAVKIKFIVAHKTFLVVTHMKDVFKFKSTIKQV